MSTMATCTKLVDNPDNIKGEEIRSDIYTFDNDDAHLLPGFSVSMNTTSQSFHRRTGTTQTKMESERDKALESKHIAIQHKKGSDGRDKEITFRLSKQKGDYRSEIATLHPEGIQSISLYSFDLNAASISSDVIFFQVRETGGSMKEKGGDRPPFSFHIKKNEEGGILIVTTNTVDQPGAPVRPDGKTYSNYNKSVKEIELNKNYHIEIHMVMDRNHPFIRVTVDKNNVFEQYSPFGAIDSTKFYSKQGVYAPQQKNKEGSNDSEVSFDNLKKEHHQYNPVVITEENKPCVTDYLLPNAMTALKENYRVHQIAAFDKYVKNSRQPASIGNTSDILETTVKHPLIIF